MKDDSRIIRMSIIMRSNRIFVLFFSARHSFVPKKIRSVEKKKKRKRKSTICIPIDEPFLFLAFGRRYVEMRGVLVSPFFFFPFCC